jgi:hypothetical protein
MASRGILGSGNNLISTARTAVDYANRKFGDYASRLQPYLGATTAAIGGAAQGQGGLWGNLGNAAGTYGTNLSNVFGNEVSGQTNANNAEAQAQMQANKNLWEGVFGVAKMFSGAGGDKAKEAAKMVGFG